MKKTISVYGIVWVLLLIVFNVVAFLVPNDKDNVAFWLGYGFITLSFVGQLVCTLVAFRSNSLQKTFYNLPLISASYGSMFLMLIGGVICMAIPSLPEWIGAILCFVILVLMIIVLVKVVKGTVVAETVNAIDEKIKMKTFFVKDLSIDAEVLMNSTQDTEIKQLTKAIYEAIRYSDPMSSDALRDVEQQIQDQFHAFSEAVNSEDVELAKSTANMLRSLIEKRNLKCKMMK